MFHTKVVEFQQMH